jgi:hypothetical protein
MAAGALDGVNGTACDALKYQQFLFSQASNNPTIACFSRGQTIGMSVSNPALSMLFFKLIPRTVDCRSSVPESRFRDLHLYLDWRKPSPLHVCVQFNEALVHSGTYDGTRTMSRGVTGSCSIARSTYIWSVKWLSTNLPQLIRFAFILICVPSRRCSDSRLLLP